MLVLSRKTGEKINVGDDIVVEVRRVSGNRVTLAVEAPRSVRILRGELKKAAEEFEEPAAEAAPETASDAVSEPYIVSHHRIDTQTLGASHTIS
ncbi:MAG: carbon storage regulator [Planctomycetota bacterium]